MTRSKEIIISEILDICTKGASKTKIVSKANLNFSIIKPYLESLIRSGLIEVTGEPTISYMTTPKGVKMLKDFKHITSQIPDLYVDIALKGK